ncbi:MAG: iron donor protein CyaY [Betaproteobacteria bacterium]
MTETEFLDQAVKVWDAIERRADAWSQDDDTEIESGRHGPVLELEFPSGRKLVLNLQTPMQQIWLASPRGAFHFGWQEGAWIDTRSGSDFWKVFMEQASLEAGRQLADTD